MHLSIFFRRVVTKEALIFLTSTSGLEKILARYVSHKPSEFLWYK
jgi:hypothetical protein